MIPGKNFYDRFEIENRNLKIEENNNISPGMMSPVITANSPKKVEMMRWGLVPHWAKDPKIGYKTFNARCEEIENKPAFRKPFRSQRCLVPANGFYEWKDKKPFQFGMKNGDYFSMAGIYDIWLDAEERPLKSFSIITTKANRIVSPIHGRMPVILQKEQEEVWLDNKNYDLNILKEIMRPGREELEVRREGVEPT